MFASASREVMEIISTENVTMNNHHYGIYTSHFEETDSLTSFFNGILFLYCNFFAMQVVIIIFMIVLSNNKARDGVEFVSTMEAFNYPIFGTQWHPEKNDFE